MVEDYTRIVPTLLRKSKSAPFQQRFVIVACSFGHPVQVNIDLPSQKFVTHTMSPTIPMAYPAAKPVNPTDKPAAKWRNELKRGYASSGFMDPATSTEITRAYTAMIPDMTTGMRD